MAEITRMKAIREFFPVKPASELPEDYRLAANASNVACFKAEWDRLTEDDRQELALLIIAETGDTLKV